MVFVGGPATVVCGGRVIQGEDPTLPPRDNPADRPTDQFLELPARGATGQLEAGRGRRQAERQDDPGARSLYVLPQKRQAAPPEDLARRPASHSFWPAPHGLHEADLLDPRAEDGQTLVQV